MRELDPFDASVLYALARAQENPRAQENHNLRDKLVDRLSTEEGKEIARAILSDDPEQLDVSEDAKVTAASLKRAVAV